MKLRDLVVKAPPQYGDIEISGITADSREVKPGFLFVAVPGVKADGSQFITDAFQRGAAAIVSEAAATSEYKIPLLHVGDARLALSQAAAVFYPHQPKTIVAVTGTSGKTSVADFVRQIFQLNGLMSASIGTLGVIRSDGQSNGSLTTPDPVTLHATLQTLADDGVQHVAMEASSHGLDQKRLHGVRLTAAAFTNLGHDHLDYHSTVSDYLTAKMRLFSELLPVGSPAIINADSRHVADVVKVVESSGRRAVRVGKNGHDIRITEHLRDGFSQIFTVEHNGRSYNVRLNLLGDFQVDNVIVAAGLAIAAGLKPADVFSSFSKLSGVPGRLEIVGQTRGGIVLVDYAHKPEALEAALSTLKPFAGGKLRVVFGCGGDRDRAKRPMMGAIAARLADDIIITDDNPRSEEPASIREEILRAAPQARNIGNRRAAIAEAIHSINAGDVVLVAGKGHETGQIIGARVEPFSDKEEAMAAIRRYS